MSFYIIQIMRLLVWHSKAAVTGGCNEKSLSGRNKVCRNLARFDEKLMTFRTKVAYIRDHMLTLLGFSLKCRHIVADALRKLRMRTERPLSFVPVTRKQKLLRSFSL